MAIIHIKRRKEPIIVSEERAKKLKDVWLKTPKSADLIDLDEWSGAMSEIVSIELEKKETKKVAIDYELEQAKIEKGILATPISQRAKMLGQFKLSWFMRSGMIEKEPPADVLGKAEKLAFEFYTKNPNVIRVYPEVFEPLLFVKFGIRKNKSVNDALVERMVVPEPHIEVSDVPF